MKFSAQVKAIRYLKRNAAEIGKSIMVTRKPLLTTQSGAAKRGAANVRSCEENEETLALLTLLALGKHEIDGGHFRGADEVFDEL